LVLLVRKVHMAVPMAASRWKAPSFALQVTCHSGALRGGGRKILRIGRNGTKASGFSPLELEGQLVLRFAVICVLTKVRWLGQLVRKVNWLDSL